MNYYPESQVQNINDEGSGSSRRTVVKGAIWSVPIIAASVEAPRIAASGIPGAIAFGSPSYSAPPNGTITGISGTVDPGQGQPLPVVIGLTYPEGFSGPATAAVDAVGHFAVGTVTAPEVVTTGLLVASAPEFISGSTSLEVVPVPAP